MSIDLVELREKFVGATPKDHRIVIVAFICHISATLSKTLICLFKFSKHKYDIFASLVPRIIQINQ